MRGPVTVSGVSLSGRLHHITGTVQPGSVTHILGQNGAGKSTLLQIIGGLMQPDTGGVRIASQNLLSMSLGELADFRCFHAQHAVIPFGLKVNEYLHFYSGDDNEGVRALAQPARLDIAHLLARRLNTLSGGEQQRVNIVRALAQCWRQLKNGTALVVLDEPLQGLDIRHQLSLCALCNDLASQGNTLIISCHDIQLSANHAHFIWLLKRGELHFDGEVKHVINVANLTATFGCDFAISKMQNDYQISAKAPIEARDL